jgi:hypothetical protein
MQIAPIMDEAVAAWEDEGGSRLAAKPLTGTLNQIEWAEQLKAKVGAEFDRVANALETKARQQAEPDQIATRAMIAILAEQRAQVMANDQAGYFIREWQDLDGRVRQMLAGDSRYQAIKAARFTIQIPTGDPSA